MNATTWVEISGEALEHNFRAVAAHAGAQVCAVVKADAYGHGLIEASRVFAAAGARWLAVTRAEEARRLRAAGIDTHVLILTPPPAHPLLVEAITTACSITLSDATDAPRFAAAAREAGTQARVHVKVETGMGRFGIPVADAPDIVAGIANDPDLVLEGVFTHFADAAGTNGTQQLAKFETMRTSLGKHAARTLLHASNSAGLLSLAAARYDMVRIGTLLYGQNPPGAQAPFEVRDTLSWCATVVAVRTLAPGDSVGYGSEYTARKHQRVATLPIGWADGFTAEPNARTPSIGGAAVAGARALAGVTRSDPRFVWFGQRRAPVLGRVGMQAVTVNIADLPDVIVGSVARIPARRALISANIERVVV